jgi:hypothetical protein
MNARSLQSLLPGVKSPLLMLDAWAYSQRLFLRQRAIPWLDPKAFDAFYRQMLALFRPQIAVLDLERFVRAHLQRRPGLRELMDRQPTPALSVGKVLQDDELALSMARLIDATAEARGSRPLAITLSSPIAFLRRWHDPSQGGREPTPQPNDGEFIAGAMAEFLGSFGSLGTAALMVVDREGEAACPRYGPALVPLAKLCRVQSCRLMLATRAAVDASLFDWVFAPHGADGLWMDEAFSNPSFRPKAYPAVFATVPDDAPPESVHYVLEQWRA